MAVVNEVSVLGDAEAADGHVEFLRRQQRGQFRARPAVEFSLDAFAVGIFGGIKTTVWMRHVAQHVVEDVPRHRCVPRFAADEKRVEVKLRELRIVVEHLLEVRHEPFGIHRVAREAAAKLVVNPTRRHLVAHVQHHALRLLVVRTPGISQEQLRLAWLRKFRRAAEAAVARVVRFLEAQAGVLEHGGGERELGVGGIGFGHRLHACVHFGGGSEQVVAARFPQLMDVFQELQKTRTTVARVRRKISAAVERFQIRRQKNIHGPAAGAGRGLHEGHVNLVHVRPLLAVHLDADEVFVEIRADLFVLKRFAFHDVAPMAGRVADAQEDGLVFAAGFRERLVVPREPVHGIVRVLEEVGGFFARETVGVRVAGGVGVHGVVGFKFNGGRMARGNPRDREGQQKSAGKFFHPVNHDAPEEAAVTSGKSQGWGKGCRATICRRPPWRAGLPSWRAVKFPRPCARNRRDCLRQNLREVIRGRRQIDPDFARGRRSGRSCFSGRSRGNFFRGRRGRGVGRGKFIRGQPHARGANHDGVFHTGLERGDGGGVIGVRGFVAG